MLKWDDWAFHGVTVWFIHVDGVVNLIISLRNGI